MTKPLVLIDGSSYLYRAFHALPPLTSSRGEPTGAIYGVLNMIRKLINDVKPEHIAVVFDPRGKTTRDAIYPEYKANRKEMPDDLRVQIEPLMEMIKAMGLPLVIVEGVEADDVIATLARRAKEEGMTTLISTGDKDMAQLVDEHITLINTMSNAVLDPKGVEAKFGVKPESIIDYLALMGDNVDNIPGVPGVGPKTAAKLIQAYGNLESVIEHADDIKGKLGESLRENIEQVTLAKQLVTIDQRVDLPVKIEDLTQKKPDTEKLTEYFKRFEFRSWLGEMLNAQGEQAENIYGQTQGSSPVRDYQIILSETEFENWLKKIEETDVFAIDTETTDLNPLDAKLVGISLSVAPHQAAYVPLEHHYLDAPRQLHRDGVLKRLKPLLENPNNPKVGHNLKYDYNVLMNYDIQMQGMKFDSMLESYVLNSSTSRHDMDSLSLKYLGVQTTTFEQIAKKGREWLTFDQIDIETAGHYAAEDADITLQLHHYFWSKLEKQKGLRHAFESIEMPLVPVLARMERAGVCIDAEMLKAQGGELHQRLHDLEQQTYRLADCEFNLASPKQLQEILFERLKLPVIERTPKGQASTAENVLQELALDYPLPKLILEHRSLSKLKSTYIDKLPLQVHPRTGRVHTSYNQAVTSTGRLSSTDPNLQNIPIRTEEGRRIRQAFIAPVHYKLIAADYSQIELRIMAHSSQDEGLLRAFAEGIDIHRATAAEVFGVTLGQVDDLMRRHAKAINFGLLYGMSSFGLARQLGVERDAAQTYMDIYFKRYPGVKKYMEEVREKARHQGYVETLLGHRVYLPEIKASNFQRRQAAERQAINAPMQGTAAEIIKLAMVQIDQWIQSEKLDIKMIMQVHDELVFEVHESLIEQAGIEIKKRMMQAVELTVPLEVSVGVGNNWDEAH